MVNGNFTKDKQYIRIVWHSRNYREDRNNNEVNLRNVSTQEMKLTVKTTHFILQSWLPWFYLHKKKYNILCSSLLL